MANGDDEAGGRATDAVSMQVHLIAEPAAPCFGLAGASPISPILGLTFL